MLKYIPERINRLSTRSPVSAPMLPTMVPPVSSRRVVADCNADKRMESIVTASFAQRRDREAQACVVGLTS